MKTRELPNNEFDTSRPEIQRVVCDIPTMQRWEILRRSRQACTVPARAAAAASQAKPFQVYLALNRLAEPELPMAELFSAEAESYRERLQQVESSASRILSPRELQVAELLVKGQSRPEIANELGLTANTVGSLSKLIYRKLGVTTRAALVARMRLG